MKRLLPYLLLSVVVIATYILIVFQLDHEVVRRLEQSFSEQQAIHVTLSARSIEDWFTAQVDLLAVNAQRPVFRMLNLVRAQQTEQDIRLTLSQNLPKTMLAGGYAVMGLSPIIVQRDTPESAYAAELLVDWLDAYSSAVLESGEPFATPLAATPDYQLLGILYPINANAILAAVVDFHLALDNYIIPIRSGEYGAAWVQDHDGMVIYDHETEIIGQNVRVINRDYAQLQTIFDRFLVEHMGTGEYTFTLERGGAVRRKLVAWHNAKLANLSLTIALSAPDTEVSQQLQASRMRNLLLSIAFTVLLIGAWLLTFQWQQRDLRRLVEERTATLTDINARLQQEIIERKQAEVALAEERNLLRTVIDSIPDYISVKDVHGRYLMVNMTGVAGRLARSREDVIGKTDDDFISPERARQYELEEQEVMRSNTPQMNYERNHHMLQGDDKWFLSSRVPFHNHQGEVIGLVTISRDITHMKLTEQALRREQRLFTRGPVVVFRGLANAERDMEYVSPNVTQFGYMPQDFTDGRVRYNEMIHPEDREHVTRIIQEYTESGASSFELDYRIITGSRETIWLTDFTSIVRDAEGTATHYDSYVLDITERKNAEAELSLSHEILKQMPDAIILTDMNGVVTRWMGSAEELFGYTTEEAVGKRVEFISHPRVRDFQTDRVFEEISNTGQFHGEISCVGKDGQEIPVEVTVKTVLDAHGHYMATIGINRDIRERKQAEQQALELRMERERARIMAEFIQSASHLFRTPLSIIHTKLYLLRHLVHDERAEPHLSGIQEQSDQILRLIEALVAMIRLDSQETMTSHPIRLGTLLGEVPAALQTAMEEKEIDCVFDLAPHLSPVMGSVSDLHQAYCQLIENAIRFTPRGGKIHVRAYEEGQHAVIEVSDNGVGIASEELPLIFERFYRVDKAHTTLGFGLGLSIARKIVENHHGTIEAHSVPGEGSTFRILLPLMIEPERAR